MKHLLDEDTPDEYIDFDYCIVGEEKKFSQVGELK